MEPKLIDSLRKEAASLDGQVKEFSGDLDLIEKVADLAWDNATSSISDTEVRRMLKRIVKEGGNLPAALHRQIAAMTKQLEEISRQLTEAHPPLE